MPVRKIPDVLVGTGYGQRGDVLLALAAE